MKKLKSIGKQKIVRIISIIIFDIIALILSSALALFLRFEMLDIPQMYYNNFCNYVVIDIIIMISIFTFFKLYQSVWTLASVIELINIVLACFLYELLEFIYKFLLSISMPRSYFIIKFLIFTLFIGSIRFGYRIIRVLKSYYTNSLDKKNTMVIGAGQAGNMIIKEIYHNPANFKNKIRCVIDDNSYKWGKYIHGIPIAGGRDKIELNAGKYKIEEIIIAIPSIIGEELNDIIKSCQNTGCNIRILPKLSAMVGKVSVRELKDLSYEDFLGRREIKVNDEQIARKLKDKTVLVTGGGGSIGSELCRQIVKCEPKKLIILDIYENNAYDLQQEILRNNPNVNLDVVIASVRDYNRIDSIFKNNKIDYVYHAAAHKHVPLMEDNSNEAIKNNCLGTLNLAKASVKYKVNKFVLISTDKAVKPTNVMGATKRICEMIIQAFDKKSDTDFVAVRFGNVLGSNGSVIPLFIKQIDNGGPVTVTDKEITRYFMTIPEAVLLILQAFTYAEGGEIFVLDMGKPVKIYDLAEQLIKLKGYIPHKDIEIKIVGLRPGEKLYEELLMAEEGLKETDNNLIHIAKPIKMNDEKFMDDLDKLIKLAYLNKDNMEIKRQVATIVDTYKIKESEK